MKIQIKRTNRKTVAIQIRDGEVIVSAPHDTSKDFIENFVNEKKDWIQKHLDRYEPQGYQINQSLRVFDVVYQTQICEGKQFGIDIEGDMITITKPVKMKLETLQGRVDDYFKAELLSYLDERVPFYSEKLGLSTPPFIIRKFKRIHGRCMRGGELAFNTYLYHDAKKFIDYVVLHECAHLIEFNHSDKFYALIDEHMPDYKIRIHKKKNRMINPA